MARLLIRNIGLEGQSLELRLGTNRIGRSTENDFQINHPGVSRFHCEVTLTSEGAALRDLDSTNGVTINGQRVTHVWLEAGEIIQLGAVEILVESTSMNIVIPRFADTSLPAVPVFAENGSMRCPRHGWSHSVYQCTSCREFLCEACVRRLTRTDGEVLLLCPECSNPVEPVRTATTEEETSSAEAAAETAKLKLTQKIPSPTS